MGNASDILNQAKHLTRTEREAIFWWLMPEVVFHESRTQIEPSGEKIESVLVSRIDGPFSSLDDDLEDRVVIWWKKKLNGDFGSQG